MVNVAILGFGVVGSGVAEVLTGTGEGIHKKADDLLALKYILDVRQFPDSPFAGCFVQDFSVIENDPEVQVVVETIGGMGAALDFTERALKAGKSVVTSNKELVATHGRRLLALAAEHQAVYLFEASVGGGIPILRPLSECMAANAILEICGILNGTANYIFTRMVQDGIPFAQALKGPRPTGMLSRIPPPTWRGRTPVGSCASSPPLPSAGSCCRSRCPPPASPRLPWRTRPMPPPAAGGLSCCWAHCPGGREGLCLCGTPFCGPAGPPGRCGGCVQCYFGEGRCHRRRDVLWQRGREASHRQRGGGRCDCRCPAAGAGQLSSLEPQPAGGRGFPDTLAPSGMSRLAQGTLEGERLTIPGAAEGESGWLTPAMTRPELEQQLAGKAVLAVIRVLD